MTLTDITSSALQFFEDAYAGTTRKDDPAKWDPYADDLESWCVIYADSIGGDVHRRSQGERPRVQITCRTYGRKGASMYTSLAEAEAAKAVLHQAIIPIKDYSESGEPQIGTLILEEARVTREKQEDEQWQQHLVVVEGTAYPE